MNLLLSLCSILLVSFQTPSPDCEQNKDCQSGAGCEQMAGGEQQAGCESDADCGSKADCGSDADCGSKADCGSGADCSSMANSSSTPVFTAQSHCPVDGSTLKNRDHFVDYEGQRTFLCEDKKCKTYFTAFPDKWLASLEKLGEAPMNTQKVCPITGLPVNKDSLTVWVGNKSVRVCCNGCVAQVKANPSVFLDKMEGRKAQEKCAVMGGKIIPQNAFGVKGSLVNQCCPGCEGKWRDNPKKFFSKLAKEKVVLQPVLDRCAVHPDKAALPTQFVTLGSRRFYFSDSKCRTEFLSNPQASLKAMPDVAKGKLPTTPLFAQLASMQKPANAAAPAMGMKGGCGMKEGGCNGMMKGKMKADCDSKAKADCDGKAKAECDSKTKASCDGKAKAECDDKKKGACDAKAKAACEAGGSTCKDC